MNLVTVMESHNASDLAVIKTILGDHGIECYLKNEFSAQELIHIPYITVELQVADVDVERALEVLQKIENA